MPTPAHKPRRLSSQTASRIATRTHLVTILTGECIKDRTWYPSLRREGLRCGCIKCYPAAYCEAKDEKGRRCRNLKSRVFEASQYSYCYPHYRERVRAEEMKSAGEILKQLATVGVGVEVK
jgi:hypothetical protein